MTGGSGWAGGIVFYPDAVPSPLQFVQPMECLQTDRLPEGDDWVYEVKLDGFRAQAVRSKKGALLLSRNGKDLGGRFPEVVRALVAALPPESIVDGELAALDADGRPNFSLIQNSALSGATFVFFAFDLLVLENHDLRQEPLRVRREKLKARLIPSRAIELSESFKVPAAQMLSLVREHGLEGVVAKRLSSRYEEGRRTGAWLKMRINLGQEFVIGGYTRGTHGFDALVIGFYKGGELHFCAKVRNGFVPASRRDLFRSLDGRQSPVCPFVNLPEKNGGRWGQGLTASKMAECVWLQPDLVGQFSFLEWTPADHLRHVSFVGLRDDKDPLLVVKEVGSVRDPKKPPQSTRTHSGRVRSASRKAS